MYAFNIYNSPANETYKGAGHAWAAIKGGRVIALEYMGEFSFDRSQLPAWILAVLEVEPGLRDHDFKVKYIPPLILSKIRRTAIDNGHAEKGPRGGIIKPSDIAKEAQNIINVMEHEQFGEFRKTCRARLSKLGFVVSGMCSCGEFITKGEIFI